MSRGSRRRSRRSEADLFDAGRIVHDPKSDDLPREVMRSEDADNKMLLRLLHPEKPVYPWDSPRPDVPRQYVARQLRITGFRYGARTAPPSPRGGERTLVFRVPRRVKACVDRKQRREVLFAFRRAGYRGSARKRFWRRTQDSQWRC